VVPSAHVDRHGDLAPTTYRVLTDTPPNFSTRVLDDSPGSWESPTGDPWSAVACSSIRDVRFFADDVRKRQCSPAGVHQTRYTVFTLACVTAVKCQVTSPSAYDAANGKQTWFLFILLRYKPNAPKEISLHPRHSILKTFLSRTNVN